MPRRKTLPALVHHKPSGHARVRIAGRDFYLGRYGTPEAEEEYRKLLAEWLATGRLPAPRGSAAPVGHHDQAPASDSTGPLVNELILAYWRYAQGYYRKNGRPTDHLYLIKGVLRLLREHHGRSPVAAFGPRELKALRAVLVHKGLTRTGVNRRIDAIRQVFRRGVEEDLVPPEVLQKLAAVARLKKGRSPAPDPEPVGPVSADDLAKTLPCLGPIVRDMVLLQLLAGARPGELCGLRPCDVDTSGEVWEFRPEEHKNEHHGKPRVVCFGGQAQEVLAKYLDGRPPDAYCFSPREAERERLAALAAARKTPLSYGNRPGTNRKAAPKRVKGVRYAVASYRQAIHRACDRAQVPRWSPNRLRHARATELRKLFGAEAARVVLGHSRLSTTEIYAERDLEQARRIMREVG